MKRLRVFFAILLVFLGVFVIGFYFDKVSAQAVCGGEGANALIMRLSDTTNAHGEVYNGAGNYPHEICFNNIFTGQSVPVNPDRSCNNGGVVLRLSDTTNAHAEAPLGTTAGYSNVCYPNLACQSILSDNCPSGTNEVVRLSDSTNAHLALAGQGNYNNKICCSYSPQGQIAEVEWQNLNGARINSGTAICMDRWVQIYARTTNVLANTQVNFKIYDYDSIGGDDLLGNFPAYIINNEARSQIDMTDPIVQAVIQYALSESGEGNDLEVYFVASISSISSDSETSYQIILDEDAMCQEPVINVEIIAPVHRGIYYRDVPVNFHGACSSSVGPATLTWEIEQGGNNVISGGNVNSPSFTHTFSNSGQANVRLTCTDDSTGKNARKEASVLVVASNFVFAYINEPVFDAVVVNNPPACFGQPSGAGLCPYFFPTQINFNADDSYAVGVSGCSVQCLAGNCPEQTETSLQSCNANQGSISVIPNPSTGNIWGAINFEWTFRSDAGWTATWPNNGMSKVTGFTRFDKLSNQINDKHIDVRLTYGSEGSSISQTFSRDFTLGRCLNNGNVYLHPTNGQQSTSNVVNACLGPDGRENSGDECCPSGQSCVESSPGNGLYFCRIDSTPITECSDFTTESACNSNTNTEYPINSLGGQQHLGVCEYAECVWESGSCNVAVSKIPENPQTGECISTSSPNQVCNYQISSSICQNGQKTIAYSLSSGSPSCLERPSITVPCGNLNFELGFFDFTHFITAMIIIALIYAILGLRKNEN